LFCSLSALLQLAPGFARLVGHLHLRDALELERVDGGADIALGVRLHTPTNKQTNIEVRPLVQPYYCSSWQ